MAAGRRNGMLSSANSMKIDCQSHILPPAYAEALAGNRRPPFTRVDADSYTVSYPGMQTFRMDRELYSVATKLRAMDAAGIDVSVISVNMPGPELLEPEVGVAAARTCNEELAAACARHPQRLAGLACLPWQVPDAALAELERAAGELGLRGVMLYSHVGAGPVDGAAYLPIYARLEELGLPLVLHPCVPPWGAEIGDYSMITMVGLMVDHSFAAGCDPRLWRPQEETSQSMAQWLRLGGQTWIRNWWLISLTTSSWPAAPSALPAAPLGC